MPVRIPPRTPKYRLHKPTGQSFVEIEGKRHYLGLHNTPASIKMYARVIAEWEANGYSLPVPKDQLVMLELVDKFLQHCDVYYVDRAGNPTSTIYEMTRVTSTLTELYGDVPVKDFGPLALRAVRQVWIKDDLTITTINKYTGKVRALFKWGVSNQLVDNEVYQAVCTVPGLRHGRGVGRDSLVRQTVPQEHVEATVSHMPSPLKAIIRLLLLTGARPSEILRLKRGDIDCTGPVWSAVIREHKLSYKGIKRTLYFGPRAIKILRPFLLRNDNAYLFSPKEAEAERHSNCDHHRRPNQKPNPKMTDRVIGDHYDHTGLAKAIRRVCDDHEIPRWTAYQLRHTACTQIEASADIETARAILGHANIDTTAIYLHKDHKTAVAWAATHG